MERVGGFDYKLSRSITTDCQICLTIGVEETASRITSTLDWDFFYCSNCENWFKVSQKDHDVAFLIQDKKQLAALEYYEKTLGSDGNREQLDLIRKIPRRLASGFYQLVSPYLVEDDQDKPRV